MSSKAIYLTAMFSGIITVILVFVLLYVRKHQEKWTIMSFVAALLFGFATVAQVVLAASPPGSGGSGSGGSGSGGSGSGGSGSGTPAAPTAGPVTSDPASCPTAGDLRYELVATRDGARSVKVTAKASGRPEPGLTYWFVLEVDYGNGNSEFYPRQTITACPSPFQVGIPAEADPKYVRRGRVYGLDSTLNAQAEVLVQRQTTTRVDDFFKDAPGKPVSNEVSLPF
ncbi:hypothetical protein GCM10010172_60750 [Paractinoplanes ferrugineus]|uniref:Uncharacterized protein n=1 Tax=Paractinoplanes ferrugineus TaxID=113564 RepID=A0A919MNT3_9ACTN|nr:hypothetical protein [Actinoplanes ferrugineus]GIE14597.1 hypothetical protein Afe05nite_64370 [Actinoplanes ferrugineus]